MQRNESYAGSIHRGKCDNEEKRMSSVRRCTDYCGIADNRCGAFVDVFLRASIASAFIHIILRVIKYKGSIGRTSTICRHGNANFFDSIGSRATI
jgi:hypothetical protein